MVTEFLRVPREPDSMSVPMLSIVQTDVSPSLK